MGTTALFSRKGSNHLWFGMIKLIFCLYYDMLLWFWRIHWPASMEAWRTTLQSYRVSVPERATDNEHHVDTARKSIFIFINIPQMMNQREKLYRKFNITWISVSGIWRENFFYINIPHVVNQWELYRKFEEQEVLLHENEYWRYHQKTVRDFPRFSPVRTRDLYTSHHIPCHWRMAGSLGSSLTPVGEADGQI